MKLRDIVIAGSLSVFLASCSGGKAADYSKSDWIKVRYNREIWSGYMGENIQRSRFDWEIYQASVEGKNKIKLRTFKGDSLYLPDLDGNGMVRSGKIFQMK